MISCRRPPLISGVLAVRETARHPLPPEALRRSATPTMVLATSLLSPAIRQSPSPFTGTLAVESVEWKVPMSSDVTALVVAVAGVAGTLASAVSTQVLAMRSRVRELGAQENQRREDRTQALQNARRAEAKTAIAAYLEVTQRLQTQLYAREHGREFEDVAVLVEQIWLAHAQVDILCSDRLRLPLVRHAQALNDVARHRDCHEDWWGFVLPYKAALLDAVRGELRWPDDVELG